MKTKIIYLLLAFMSLTCVLSAQTKDSINIELKGETLPTALKKLEQVSGYRILFYIQRCTIVSGNGLHSRKYDYTSDRKNTGKQTTYLCAKRR